MKLLNKFFVLVLVASLMFTLAACGKNEGSQNSKPNDTASKPTVSTPSENNTPTESQPEESKPEESKPEESKPDPKPESKPEPVKKTPAELIIGKWKGLSDISSGLVDAGFEITEDVKIEVNTEFTAAGSIIEKANKTQMSTVLRSVLKQSINKALAEENVTVEDFEAQLGMTVDEYVETFVTAFQNSYTYTAEYKFNGNTLLVKFDGDEDFAETNYEFINDNTLRIYSDSEETIYTRVK